MLVWISEVREGHKTNLGCLNGHPTKQTFLFTFMFFSLVFFHISIPVLNGLLKLMMNIIIKLLLLFLLKSKRFYSVIVGEGCGMGGVGVQWQIALLFKPIDTNFFWNKNIQTVPQWHASLLSGWYDLLIWKQCNHNALP